MTATHRRSWRERILARWGALCHDHAGLVTLIALAITAFFSYFAATIDINLGFLALLDENDPLVQRVQDANDNFGDLSYMVVGLTTPAGEAADKQRLIRFAHTLAPKLKKHPDLIGRVVARVELDEMMRWAPLFLSENEVAEFVAESKERQGDLRALFRDVRLVPFLDRMNETLEREIIEEEEITDEADALQRLQALGAFYETAWSYLDDDPETEAGPAKRSLRKLVLPAGDDEITDDDYFFYDNDRLLVMRVMTPRPADDYIYIEEVLAMVDAAVADVKREVPGVEVLLAGNMPVMRDEHQALVHDMKFTTLASLVIVLIIFAVVFRKLTDLVLIAVCLLSGLGITFGVTEFAIGYLSLLTAFFGAIMIGLGIDFAIHLISRYGEGIRQGLAVREAIINGMAGAGPGILTGGITTAAAFLVLMIARFKGLAQLGFVSGMGILVMLLLMFTLLPALIALRDRRKVSAELTIRSIGDSVPLGRLADLAIDRPKLATVVILIVSILAAFGVWRSSFNYDYRSLEPRGSIALAHIDEVEKRLGFSIDYAMYFGDTVEDCRRLAAAVEQKPTIAKVDAISDYVPENQAAKNLRLRELAPIFADITVQERPAARASFAPEDLRAYAAAARGSARVVRAVLQLAILGGQFDVEDEARRVVEQVNDFATRVERVAVEKPAQVGAMRYEGFVAAELESLLENLRMATKGEVLTVARLPEQIRENFLGHDGRMAVFAYPTGNVWNKQFMAEHNNEVLSVDPSAISVPILFERVFANIIEDFRSSIWFSLAAVFLLVILDFRRPLTSILALVPLMVGALWMVGAMPYIGMRFNLVNVAIVPLILGIGIDNGVHILHRYRMEQERRVHAAVEHTGKAILLSSLTTMAGFGMLGLATYVAIGSLGQLLVIGVGACFVTSVFVLPLILARIDRKGWKV
ncbi:MAG: MMPL family transporter [Candidatus Lernaella stagnicola]|nr:MMPL family transporter [Candidatus Lernaella stagnicola]